MELGTIVTLAYKGTLDDGTEFGYADAEHPMKFQTGMDMAIDGFEKAIMEMEGIVGEKKTFTVDQYDAYGEYLDDFTTTVPEFQIPTRVYVGKRVMMSEGQDGGTYPATVLAIEDGKVTFDMNHPLAGKDLTFDVEILEIEDPPDNFVSQAEKARHLREQGKLLGMDEADSFR